MKYTDPILGNSDIFRMCRGVFTFFSNALKQSITYRFSRYIFLKSAMISDCLARFLAPAVLCFRESILYKALSFRLDRLKPKK